MSHYNREEPHCCEAASWRIVSSSRKAIETEASQHLSVVPEVSTSAVARSHLHFRQPATSPARGAAAVTASCSASPTNSSISSASSSQGRAKPGVPVAEGTAYRTPTTSHEEYTRHGHDGHWAPSDSKYHAHSHHGYYYYQPHHQHSNGQVYPYSYRPHPHNSANAVSFSSRVERPLAHYPPATRQRLPGPFRPPPFPVERETGHGAKDERPPSVIYLKPRPSAASIAHLYAGGTPSKKQEYIHEVFPQDILCGRGAPTANQPGNQFFREVVQKYQSRYLAAKRIDKPDIAMKLLKMVQQRGGRFLKRCKVYKGRDSVGHFCWEDIGEQRAYEKACQALREGAPEIRRQMLAREERIKQQAAKKKKAVASVAPDARDDQCRGDRAAPERASDCERV